jgi:hypothetical protein
MRESASELGKKALALLILLGAAYLLFKLVVGAVSAILWTVFVIVAVVAGIWALTRLL